MAIELHPVVDDIFGLGLRGDDLSVTQIFARAALVYLVALLLVRIGRNRFLGHYTVFDIVLGFVFGSMLSRAINGQAPVLETLLAGALLLAIHEVFAILGARSHWFSRWTKGEPETLIEDGRPDWDRVRHNHLSRADLEEAIRIGGHTDSAEHVQTARLERNGKISVVPKLRARVVDVRVAEGVQTVRIVVDV